MKKLISVITILSLVLGTVTAYAGMEESIIEEGVDKDSTDVVVEEVNEESTIATDNIELLPILEKSNIDVSSGSVYDLSNEASAATIKSLTDGSVIIKYKSTSDNQYQSLFSVANATTGNQDRHFHIYVTPTGVLGMELRNTDADFKYTMSASSAVNANSINIIAFKADSTTKEYKLFANGSLVAMLSKDNYKFLSNILNTNTISLGGTVRQGVIAYPFAGSIYETKVFSSALSDAELIAATNHSSIIPEGIIFEKSSINIQEGQGYDLSTESGAEYVEALMKGTIIVAYTSTSANPYQSLISVGNGTTGNQNRHFHIYITNTGEVGMELRNGDDVLKYTLSRPAAVRSLYHSQRVQNTVAFKADPINKQYKLFANGDLIATLDVDVYKFINDITNVDNVMLGGTKRQGIVAYPFGGTIGNVKVYSTVLSDEDLKTMTGITSYGTNIFSAGDTTNSDYFRIPALLTLKSGTVVAAADARYGGSHDAKSNIDMAFSKSVDGGVTWSNPTLPMCFDDYIGKSIDWPRDSVGRNVQIQGSATFIDPVLLQDQDTGRLFYFADAMPAGIGVSNASVGSGYKTIDGKKYLKLRWHADGSSTYDYSIRENGVIYNDTTNQPTEYSVDGEYDLYKNNVALTCKQYDYNFSGLTLLETATNVDVNMNVFYKDSIFKVFPTNYLAMKYSDDEGNTWSDLNLISSFKPDNSKFLVVGPGVGKQISTGQYDGRLLVPLYSTSNTELAFMYSDDHGVTWNYVSADNGGTGATAEAQIVEMPDGSLKTYMRTASGNIAEVTSLDGGETWSDRVEVPQLKAASYGTQVSVINYSGLIDGKPAIILSAPNSTSARREGKIWIGLITDTGATGINKYSINWAYSYAVDDANIGYSYSCLTELPNGDIGLLYEKYDAWSRNELHLKNVLKYESFTINELK